MNRSRSVILSEVDLYDWFADVSINGLADVCAGDRLVAFINADVAIGVYFDLCDLTQRKGFVGKQQEGGLLIVVEQVQRRLVGRTELANACPFLHLGFQTLIGNVDV